MSDLQSTQEVLTQKEIDLIQSIFKDNDDLLLSMRALFLGLETTKSEKDNIQNIFAKDEIFNLIKRRFIPTISKNTPIGTVQDDWLGSTQMVFAQSKDTIKQVLIYKARALELANRAIELLLNPNGEKINVEYNPEEDNELGTGLLTRNQYIKFIETQLLSLRTIANLKKETIIEQTKRIMKDSSR